MSEPSQRTGRRPARSRVSVVALLLTVTAGLVATAVGVLLGDAVPIGESWEALTGRGTDTATRVVLGWRLPRVLLTLLVGAALGASGAVLQSTTRNRLGSPDVIGFTAGSGLGVMVVLAFHPTAGYGAVAFGALLGGACAAVTIVALSAGRGMQGTRVVLMGVAVSAMVSSLSSWIAIHTSRATAMIAAAWGVGSFSQASWGHVVPTAVAVAPLLAVAFLLERALRQSALGDAVAAVTGVRIGRVRIAAIALSTALAAVATAAAGPVAFVALGAPALAHRLATRFGPNVALSAVVGAVLCVTADAVAQHALPVQLPTGIVTLTLGGLYLLVLLRQLGRRVL